MSYHISFQAKSVQDAIEHLESSAHQWVPTSIINKLKEGLLGISHEIDGVIVKATGHLATKESYSTSSGTFEITPITFVSNVKPIVEETLPTVSPE